MSKVSVIVPVYNAEKTLDRCVQSLISQDYLDIEIILVNDGSRDESEKLCDFYKTQYPDRIITITQNNSGPAVARNKGIETSTGDYLAFLDADDYVDSSMFSTMVKRAQANEVDMVICGYVLEKGECKKQVTYRFTDGCYKNGEERALLLSMIERASDEDIPPFSGVRLLKKSVIQDPLIRFDGKLIRSEDFHFWTKVHAHLNSVYMLGSHPFYHYVENASSITHRYIKNYWRDVQFIYQDLKEYLPKEQDISDALGAMYVMRCLMALNNATLSDKMRSASREIGEILRNPDLLKATRTLWERRWPRYRKFMKLMNKNGRAIIYLKYMSEWFKNRKTIKPI